MDTPQELHLTEPDAKATPWTVAVFPDRLRFTSGDGTRVEEISRSELGSRVEIHSGGMLGKALVARIPKPVVLKLDDTALGILNAWVGPLTREDLKGELRRRLRWTLPIGLLFALTSIPLPGDPAQGVPGVPFDPIGLVLGLGLIALSVAARVTPHPLLLALDGVWFFLLAADTVWGVVRGADSVWWLSLAAFLVLAGLHPLAAYRRFSAGGTAA